MRLVDFELDAAGMGDTGGTNFKLGSDGPYAAVMERLSPALANGAAAAAPETPIQAAAREGHMQHTTASERIPASPYEAPAPAAAPEPSAVLDDPYATPEPLAPAAEEMPAWAQTLAQQQAQLAQHLSSIGAPAAPAPEAGDPLGGLTDNDLDMLTPDQLRGLIAQTVDARGGEIAQRIVNEQLGPWQDVLGLIAERESKQAATEHFQQLQQSQVVGRFDHDEAHLRAQALVAMGHDPLTALNLAAQQQHEFEKRLWSQHRALQADTVKNVAAAPAAATPAAATATEAPPVPTGRNRYEIAKDDFFARRRPQAIPTA